MLSKNKLWNSWMMEGPADQEKDILYAIRDKDGSVTLYADEDWAMERGADPAQLRAVEIPRELYAQGTIQEVREYVATYLEEQEEQSSQA